MTGTFSLILLFLCAVYCPSYAANKQSEVRAPTGRIIGTIIKSRKGRDIHSFRGIRYAEPPTGERRFQVAVPAADWEDAFDATKEGPACPQTNETTVSEDCLRLNVYTTKLPSEEEDVKRPVIVFFHPGGFYTFSGQSTLFGPQYLLDKDVVLVTVNYRIATLGFISTGDCHAPGNLGLKDQVVALRWLKRNIAAFGGNPDCVTITGYSVGSLSVVLHMLSPMSKNLFHRGIAMSGSLLTTEPFPTEQKHLAIQQAKMLNCPTQPTGEMMKCLKSKPEQNYSDTVDKFFEWYGDPIIIWRPVVEPEIPGVDRFLTAQPVDLIRQGKINEVPLIIGTTEDEFGGVVVIFDRLVAAGNSSVYDDLNNDWFIRAPTGFLYERDTERSRRISRELYKFYFGNQRISQQNEEGLSHAYSDSVIIFPTHQTTKLLADHSTQPVYFYKFTFQGRYSFVMRNATTPFGVGHHDDLQYLFFINIYFPFFNETDPEIPMLERITSIWSNFAKTGKPIPSNNSLFENVTWKRFVSAKDNFMDLNIPMTMKTGFFPDRMQEWKRLFPLPPISDDNTHSHVQNNCTCKD